MVCASLGPTFWDTLNFLDFLEVYFFRQIGELFFIICSNKFPTSCCCSPPSGIPIIQILECFRLSQRFLSLCSYFFYSCFFILFRLNVSFFHLLQTIDLSPSFLPITVGSLYIFLYFCIFRSFNFFCCLPVVILYPFFFLVVCLYNADFYMSCGYWLFAILCYGKCLGYHMVCL